MTIQEKIDCGQICSRFKICYKESGIDELVGDFPIFSESLNRIYLYAGIKKIAILKDTNKDNFYVICIFTDKHKYIIHVCPEYLGCCLYNRYEEPLEDWHRARDLPDGRCSIDTWNRILCAIIGCELISYDNDLEKAKSNH